MAKQIFKNLPDTTTPLSAGKLNGLFDGDEAMGNIIVDTIKSKNLISGWYYGGISSTNGSDSADSSSRRTDYMSVNISSSQSYKLSGLVINHCSMFIAAYNSSKQFLGRTGAMIKTGTTDLTLSASSFSSGTPQGTGDIKYLRITLYAPESGYTIDNIVSSNSNMQLEKGTTATDFAPHQNIGYESGSNANGNYIKYDDGTLIQWGETSLTTATSSYEVGGVTTYRSDAVNQTLPVSFATGSTYNCVAQINGGDQTVLNFIYVVMTNVSTVSFRLVSTSSNYTRPFRWIAIGRWK